MKKMIRHRHILLCLLLITGMYVWDGFAQTRTEMPRKHNYYMYLKEKLDGSYQVAYDKQVWLHYEEPYSVTDTQCLRFRVFDDNHSLVVETDEYGIPANPNCPRVPIQYGDNWVTVNLSSLTSFDQFYTMEVWDSKGETRYLRFLCKSSQLSMTEMEQGWLEKPTFPADTTFSDPRVKKQTVIGTSGSRRYELTDHLGNVMAVYSDRKIGVDTDSDGYVNYYAPEIISVSDYYPYGYPIRERCFSREDYRYGFNDKENDNEVYEPSTFQDYGFRMYDTRVARFWGVDPLYRIYPWYSSYQFAGNKPVLFIDKDGQEEARREEIVHSLLHPLDALQVRNNAKKASTAAHNSNLPDARDGLQDAFRHAYWNALNARDIGALRAERFATIHEIGNTNEANNPNSFQYDPVAIEMDLFNNEIGRKLGAAYYNATDEELAALVMQALANGELKIITNIGASNIDKQLGESYHPNIEKGETVTPTYECTYEEYSGVEDAKRNKRLEKLPNSGTGANNTDSYTGENMNRKSKNTQNGY